MSKLFTECFPVEFLYVSSMQIYTTERKLALLYTRQDIQGRIYKAGKARKSL